jgi:glutathione peroxidase
LAVVAAVLVSGGLWARARFFAPPVVFETPVGSGTMYSLNTRTLSGQPAGLGQFQGKVTLVVNVASNCGYTKQYAGLESLYRELEPRGFAVLGFPSNEFGGQEPGTAEEIGSFCQRNYGVTFPLFEKVVTQQAEGQSPVYAFLGESGSLPTWNFGKYVVGRDGKVRAFFPSRVEPNDPALRATIERALAE